MYVVHQMQLALGLEQNPDSDFGKVDPLPLKARRFDCPAFLRASETSQTNHLTPTLSGDALNDCS